MLGDIEGEAWAWALSSAPSEDIWKKFELIPTPPRSPLRDTDLDLELPEDLLVSSFELPLLEGDIDTDDLLALCNDDDPSPSGVTCNHGLVGTSLVGCHKCAQLVHAGTEVRHDCMWAGHCPSDTHKVAARSHNDSCSHITDMLLDSSSLSALGGVAGFTNLADLHTDDEDDDDDSQMEEDLTLENIRPDTPSESSDTDTECEDNMMYEDDDDIDDVRQLGVSREEEVYTSNTVSVVHIDHSYHCPRVPTSLSTATTTTAPTHPHLGIQTPSDSEDEIDVVSVGSPDSAYSSASSFSTSSSRHANNNNSSSSNRNSSKRSGHRHSSKGGGRNPKDKRQQQQQHDLKSVKLATNNLPSNPSRKVRKHLQQTMAAGVRRRNGVAASSTVVDPSGTTLLIKRGGNSKSKGTKRQHEGQSSSRGSKRTSPRSDSDDPERRHLHNSLERLRRIDLRNAFEELRALVPDLAEKDKAAKVVILKKAADYCIVIRRQEQILVQERSRHMRYQSELKKRLEELQRQYR